MAGLKKLELSGNMELTTLPAGLGQLHNLEGLYLDRCPGLKALLHGLLKERMGQGERLPGRREVLQEGKGLAKLLAHLAAQA